MAMKLNTSNAFRLMDVVKVNDKKFIGNLRNDLTVELYLAATDHLSEYAGNNGPSAVANFKENLRYSLVNEIIRLTKNELSIDPIDSLSEVDWLKLIAKRYAENEDLNALAAKKFTGSVTIHFHEGKPEAIERNQKIKGKIV